MNILLVVSAMTRYKIRLISKFQYYLAKHITSLYFTYTGWAIKSDTSRTM